MASEHLIWFVVGIFYFGAFAYYLYKYSNINKRLIVNDIGIVLLDKRNGKLIRNIYYWEQTRKVCYFADLHGKSKYESLSITMFRYSFRKEQPPTIEYDLSHYFPIKFEVRHTIDKDLDSVLRRQSKKHNVAYELQVIS
ncbi:MAG: hypothetical protein IJS20_12825 [Bacteroidales bacterium]|nr:hypothetical protein [Bacteroidales bacterium]